MQTLFQNSEILELIFIDMKCSVILIGNIANSSLPLNSEYQNDDDRWFQIFWKQCFRLPDDFHNIWTWFGRLSLALINELKILYGLYFQQFASNCSNLKIGWECESCFVFCKLNGLGFKSLGFALHDVPDSSVNLQQQRVLRNPPLATSG